MNRDNRQSDRQSDWRTTELANRRSHPSRVRIRLEDGRFQITGLGAWYSYWRDPYYLMLTVPWQVFFAITIGVYAIANAICALLFLLGGEGTILNAQPGSFWDAFFFSVQTSASIGYGVMSPGNTYAHLLVTLEAIDVSRGQRAPQSNFGSANAAVSGARRSERGPDDAAIL